MGFPKTKDIIKAEIKEINDINADPTLQKLWGILDIIDTFQKNMSYANPPYEMPMNNVVPTSVKTFLEGNKYKYIVTSVPATAPVQTSYVTTWVRITKISWA
jgi:hypothetical protein